MPHSTNRGRSHLSRRQVLNIAAALRRGATTTELAKKYHRCTSLIQKIRQGRAWAWLTGFPVEAGR